MTEPCTAPPPPASGMPERPCPRCGPTVWLDLGGDVWRCRGCGFDPKVPDGPRPMAMLDETPEPSRSPAPSPMCGVCGLVAWIARGDGTCACPSCGAVRG